MYASGIKGLIIKNAQGISLGTLFENNHKHPSNNKSQRKKLYPIKPGSAKFRPLAPGLVLNIKLTGLSVCSMCWTWLKIYILSKRMCLYPTDSLDTYKPNLYWYSVVYCGSPCLSVCLSVFLLSVRLSVFLSVSVHPSVCPSDSYPLYDFHNCERKHFIFWYGNSP